MLSSKYQAYGFKGLNFHYSIFFLVMFIVFWISETMSSMMGISLAFWKTRKNKRLLLCLLVSFIWHHCICTSQFRIANRKWAMFDCCHLVKCLFITFLTFFTVKITHTCVCVCVYIYIYIYIYTHTHSQDRKKWFFSTLISTWKFFAQLKHGFYLL